MGIVALNTLNGDLEKQMTKLAAKLPVKDWVEAPEQNGFGLLGLAVVVGEAGDLANYATVSRLWRRLGCAPWQYGEKTLMGSTWKRGLEGHLPSAEWSKFGYSPRRRSISYLIGEGLVKQNVIKGAGERASETDVVVAGEPIRETDASTAGPYRLKYDVVKAHVMRTRKDWTTCGKCDGSGKLPKKKCDVCKGTGELRKRCHLHAMLLATKELLKNLWIEWNGRPPHPDILPMRKSA